jgi:hypothetical protein
MSTTRLDMQTKLQLNFNNTVFYDTQSINDSLQDGLDEVCAFTGCIYKSANLTFTQYTSYYDLLTLLPDYIGVVAVWNNTIRRWMWPQSLKKFNQVRIDWDTAYGTPYYFCPINFRYMAIYMKPSVPNYGQMFVFYRASAPTLVDTTPIPIPDEHITALEAYSITDLWEQAQEWGKASEYFKSYLGNLEALRKLMRSQRNRDRYMSLR